MFKDLELKNYEMFRAMFDPRKVDKAAQMALNSAVTRGKAEAARQLTARWNLKRADVGRATRVIKASKNAGVATITISGRPLSLTYFGAQWFRGQRVTSRKSSSVRKRPTGRSGVFVDILRGEPTTHKPHAFIATMKSGHIGVFERVPGSRMKSKDKEQIIERKTITIASMFGQPEIMDPTIDHIGQHLDQEFPRLIEVLFGR